MTMLFLQPLSCCIIIGHSLMMFLPADAAGPKSPEVVAVSKAFDNVSFSYHIELAAEKDAFQIYRLRYPSPVKTAIEQNNTIPAELYLPRNLKPGGPPRPAVICLHILDGNVELVQIACSTLAARGIPALWFNLPYYGERGIRGVRDAAAGDPLLFETMISQSIADVRRSVDVLAARCEINPQRIGIMGISLGGILAATAAEQDARLARATLILAGGDLLPIIHQAKETRKLSAMLSGLPSHRQTEIETAIREADPLTHADRLYRRAQEGKVLMINASDDEVMPRRCTEKLARALGIADRVVWLDGLGHYTAMAALPRTLQSMVSFFAQDLPTSVQPTLPSASSSSPQRFTAHFLQQCADLLTTEPEQGRCHVVDLQFSVVAKRAEDRRPVSTGARDKIEVQPALPTGGAG